MNKAEMEMVVEICFGLKAEIARLKAEIIWLGEEEIARLGEEIARLKAEIAELRIKLKVETARSGTRPETVLSATGQLDQLLSNFSFAQLGKLLGISKATVYSWYAGKSTPRAKYMIALISKLKIPSAPPVPSESSVDKKEEEKIPW